MLPWYVFKKTGSVCSNLTPLTVTFSPPSIFMIVSKLLATQPVSAGASVPFAM